MAKPRLEYHNSAITWTASGSINLELAPKPYTITRMVLIHRLDMTSTTITDLNDPWDRVISRLALDAAGRTIFNFTNMRVAYHMGRFIGCQARRPQRLADSLTTVIQQFATVVHFGVAPWKINAAGMIEDNPFDLTGGIPPMGAGNLTLTGTFGAAAAMGTNATINSGQVDVYLFGVQPAEGDGPLAYQPRALPSWSMITPSIAATSSAGGDGTNVPAGDFLHSILLMATNGTGAPRDDSVLNSLELFQQAENRSIIKYGGQTGVIGDVKAAEIISQINRLNWAPSDDVTTAMTAIASGGTPGTLTVNAGPSDAGLIWLPVNQHAWGGHPLYGIDMRNVAEGVLRIKYGISDATGVTLDALYRKYQLNPAYPAAA